MGCRETTAVVHAAALVLGEEPGQDPIGFRLCRDVEGSACDEQLVSSGGGEKALDLSPHLGGRAVKRRGQAAFDSFLFPETQPGPLGRTHGRQGSEFAGGPGAGQRDGFGQKQFPCRLAGGGHRYVGGNQDKRPLEPT
jgi:hypothetical protein